MLFLYRPRQTWMPYRVRPRTQQGAYNMHLQQQFAGTRRVAPQPPSSSRDTVADLKELAELHASGALSDAELAVAKAKILDTAEVPG